MIFAAQVQLKAIHKITGDHESKVSWKSGRYESHLVVSSGNWHDPVLRETARMVRRGLSDEEIFSIMERHTLPGWSLADTRKEVSEMVRSARKKGFCIR